MPKFSIRSLLLLTVYFSLCALIYVIQNSAVGWVIVVATALLIAISMVYAFNNRDLFALGFSVFSMAWMLICFGYSFDSPRNFAGWKFQQPIFWTMRMGRPSPKLESFGDPANQRYTIHNFFRSDNAILNPNDNSPPSYDNAMRCFVCLSSLLAGLIGGCAFRTVMKSPSPAG